MITQTLLSHAGLPTFETLSLNPNREKEIHARCRKAGSRVCEEEHYRTGAGNDSLHKEARHGRFGKILTKIKKQEDISANFEKCWKF